MRCRDARKRLVALQDGEVGPSEGIQLREHLAECEGCRMEFGRLERLPDPVLPRVPPEIGRLLWEKVRATPVLAGVRQRGPAREAQSRQTWSGWLAADAGVSRGAMLAYGALLVLVVALGATSWVPSSMPTGTVVAMGDDVRAAPHDTVPVTHTGLPVRDIQPLEWQNASLPTEQTQ